MLTDQDVVHVRGDDLQIPVTVTLDQGRVLDGSETWEWRLRKNAEDVVLLTKTSPAGITKAGPTFQPVIILAAVDFVAAQFPDSIDPSHHIHELEMTKDGKVETVFQGQFTVLTDVVSV